MLKFRFRATTRKPDGQLNKPYIYETQFEARDISSAIQQARDYQVPPSDGRLLANANKSTRLSRYAGLGNYSARWDTN